MENKPLLDKRGGYRKLHSFTFATMIHLGTINFCKKFVPWQEDQLGKTAGQMIGAARSGRQNIIEGSERSATSKETEMKLTDVARASLAELLGDYEIFLAERGEVPWSRNDPQCIRFSALRLPAFEYTDDPRHDYRVYYNRVKRPFVEWTENKDPVISANALIVLLARTMAMITSQLKAQGDAFVEQGGFREHMYQTRVDARERKSEPEPDAPLCPECGKPMRKRIAKNGKNAGGAFWGCSAYPDCKATMPFDT